MGGKYEAFFRKSIDAREEFWAAEAEKIHWHKKWDQVLDYSRPPFSRWFVGGLTNTCYNCVDRHLDTRGDQAAITWISTEVNQERTLTYRELYNEVNAYAAVLKAHGIGPGDRVIIYLPMIAESLVAMLACMRLGAVHSVVFGGFAPHNLASRIDDARPKALITADGGMRAGRVVPYKPLVDQSIALAKTPPEHVFLINRGIAEMTTVAGRDKDLPALAAEQQGVEVPPEWRESNEPSYILYTSGTTGTPKGVQRDTGGHIVALNASMDHIYGAKPGETYWATSDIGWVVGHSYIVYAPLLHGMNTVVYEGTPINPNPAIWWKVVEEQRVNVMFSAPTAVRILRKQDPKYMGMHDISSLRTLFLAGEPLDAPSYNWVHENLADVAVVDHYWQTESGWPILSNPVGLDLQPIKPGSPTFPVYGWDLEVVEHGTGKVMPANERGVLVARPPLPPGALTTVWGNDQRFIDSYFSHFPEPLYYSGDYAIKDSDGYYFVLGRADEVINVAGHRLGTREIEEAVSGHPAVAEAAAVGVKDEVKGQAVVAIVVLKNDVTLTPEEVEEAIKKQVDSIVGPIARPREVHVVAALPKTRSGKVIRRAIIAMAEGRDTGDLSTLEDESTIEGVRKAVVHD